MTKAQITTGHVEEAVEKMLQDVDEDVAQQGGKVAFEGGVVSSDPVGALRAANEMAKEGTNEPEVVDRLLGSLAELV